MATLLAEQLEQLRADREHGASWMARRAVEVLLDVADDDFADGEQMLERLVDAGRALADSRPGVGSVGGAVGRLLAAASTHHQLEPAALRRLLNDEAQGLLDARRRAATSIAILVRDRVAGATVVTHSASATVREALVHGQPERVVCTVSNPYGEGERLAEDLRERGLDVDLVEDDDAPGELANASLFLVGADTVFRCGTLCNKIGTHDLAQAAKAAGVPVVVACEVIKLAPVSADEAPELPEPVKTVFDLTPPELLEGLVTEEGAYPIDEVAALIDRTPFLRDGYALLRRP